MIVRCVLGCSTLGVSSDVHPLDLPDPLEHFVQGGAFPVEPPVHLPQPASGDVTVWLRVPDGAVLTRVRRGDGVEVLRYPPGTEADRVETRGTGEDRRVVDVRGTRIDADGQRWHHVFRPVDDDPSRALVGMEWRADDPELHAVAVERYLARLRDEGVRSGLDAVRQKLDCDGCHPPLRPDNRSPGEHGLVARGTDAAGFFTPSTVLAADVPLERYGARDPNRTDRYVIPVCPDCPVPRAALALTDALADRDPHALAVCESWRALADHLGLPADHPCRGESP